MEESPDKSKEMERESDRLAYLTTFATSIFIQGCTVFQGILLARLLGPEGRGEFATIIFWPSAFAALGTLGVNLGLARMAAKGTGMSGLVRVAMQTALFTSLVTMLVCGLLLPSLLPHQKHDLLPTAYLFLLFIPANHLALYLQGIDHGLGNFRWLNITRALLYPVFFTGLLLTWWLGNDPVFWSVVALLVANCVVTVVRLVSRLVLSAPPFESAAYSGIWRSSTPYLVASIIGIAYLQMDKALLVWLLTPQEIGLYMAAFAASGSITILCRASGIVEFRSAAKAKRRCGFVRLAVSLRRSGILTLSGVTAFLFVLPWAIPLIYGKDFQQALTIAYLLLPGMIFGGLTTIVGEALRGQGQPIIADLPKLLGLGVMAVSGLLLSGYLGGKGIAISYVAGELVSFLGILAVALHYYSDANWLELVPGRDDLVFLKDQFLERMGRLRHKNDV